MIEVGDPFSPSYSNGHVESFDEWSAPPVSEPQASTSDESVPSPAPAVPPVAASQSLQDAKHFVSQVSEAASQLASALSAVEAERDTALREQHHLQQQVEQLQQDAQRKEEFRNRFLTGSGAELTVADLKALQSVTDALTADPDRLTTLFAVVQHAEKISKVVRVYTEVRELAEQS